MIDDVLISVAKNIFPHRALEIQKNWMRRQIRKPKDMPVRKLVAIITKMNNSLARFPEADENDKFEQSELLEIIEWSLPYEWRAKFDLKNVTYRPIMIKNASLQRLKQLRDPRL
jgi:hypothetical protein